MSTRKPDKRLLDPEAAREASKYEFPVPSREAVLSLLGEHAAPMSLEAIARALDVSGERDIMAFKRRLRAMERDGQVLRNRKRLYGLPAKMEMISGRVIGHADGFGFLVPDVGGEDLFIPPHEMRKLMHGDRTMVRVAGLDQRGRKEAAVVEVLERAHPSIVGRFDRARGLAFVVPADPRLSQDVVISPGDERDAKPGQIVVAEITQPPTARSGPVGRIAEVLGEHMAPGMEIEIAIRAHSIPFEWPPAVVREAGVYPDEVPESAKHESNRRDVRNIPLVTIDGEDARDFDDAVYAECQGKGYRLVVAIADVSHYVKSGTAIDAEGYKRGNSVYFPQHVVPMLPEALSNGLCSLNPEVDRLCMVCDMQISPRGDIKDYEFYPAVMRSQARLTYTKVAAMLVDGDSRLRSQYVDVLPHLEVLYTLFKVLHTARERRGAVDFELPETRILFDAQRKIERIEPIERNDAHRLIEECMLAANVCAAEFLKKNKVPAPYRIHEGPSSDKLVDLRTFLFELGLSLGGGDKPQAKHYAKLLNAVDQRPDRRLIHTVLLRSLSQALYSPDNVGHFALGYESYTHFTSPIRRYPDLLVHRAIKGILAKHPPHVSPELAREQGSHCSMTERRADEATREVTRWLKVEYMTEHVGDEFDGIISGVTNFGIFVELAELYVDGLVHITGLGNDYYQFDPAHHRLIGERTRRVFRLGDAVRVRVVRADLDEAKIDFELTAEPRKRTAKTRSQRDSADGKRGTSSRKTKGRRRKKRR
jgi:ribonuclease R